MKHLKQFICVLGLCIFTTACATIPVISMYKLRKFDIATTDVAVLRVAVQMPRYVRISPGGARLVVSARKIDGSYDQSQSFILEELVKDSADTTELPRPGSWVDISGYRVAPKDLGRLRSFRETIAHMKKLHGDNVEGSLSVGVDGCIRTALPDGPVLITVWIKSEETGEYVVLLDSLDIRKTMAEANQPMELPQCKG